MPQNILIVEDEVKIAELLNDYMLDAEFTPHMLHRGDEALPWLENNTPDLILLDLMLPGMNGMEICKQIRKASNIPIIMLTAKVDEIDRLLGLEVGADDYICKPFSPREVVARVKAVLRRSGTTNTINTDDNDSLQLSESSHQLIHGDKTVELTAVEFKLFQTLYNRPGHIYSRNILMENIYDDHRVVTDRTVDSHIKKLRKKLNAININDSVIHSVYGVGYKYE